MVTHGGIPSHMVENPEPNLRPTTFRPPSHMEREHPSINLAGTHNPVLMTDPNPTPDNPSGRLSGHEISRNTIPVPVRSKQGSPPPLTHNQRSVRKHPTLRILLYQGKMTRQHPLHFRFPPMLVSMHSILMTPMVMAQSTAASVHEPDPHPAPRDESTSHITIPPGTSAITLTPNPQAPASPPSRNIPPTPIDHLVLHHFAHGPLLTIKS